MAKVKQLVLISLISFWLLLYPRRSYAYLDPGTGSYMLQLLIAGLLGALFSIKMFWSRLKDFFRSMFSKRSRE